MMLSTMRVLRLLVVAGVMLALPPTLGLAQEPEEHLVIALRLNGVVDPFVASYVTSGIAAAERSDAEAVLLRIDTPGGLDSSMRKIVQGVLNSSVPVICYVSPEGARAASAGAFILMACPIAAMAPATNVGAAHPVGVSGAIESEKAENDAAEFMVSLAERRDRNADWAERAVRESVSASAEEALDLGIIDLVAPSEPELFRAVDGRTVEVAGGEEVTLSLTGATVEPRRMGLAVRFLHSLLSPNLAFIFFYLGLALIVVEFFVPGLVAGTIGVILLLLAIVALGMLPVQLLGVLLLIASLVFFFVELKVPGVGLATVGAVTALVLGGLFLFDPSVPSARVSPWVIAPVAGLAGLFFTFVLRAAIRLRRQPPASGTKPLLGAEGRAVTALDPRGVVLVASEEWTADSVSGPIPAGASIRVVGVEGVRLTVEPMAREPEAGAAVGPGSVAGKGESSE
jgi:membrane-bound serine protease (ClpP class)